jgi:amino acid adenylation domain-containing protein
MYLTSKWGGKTMEARRSSGCSIVGRWVRFPGCASESDFWEALTTKRSLVGNMSPERRALVHLGTNARWGRAQDVSGVFLDNIDCFDASLFGVSRPAAKLTDPRQRLLMEATWAAIEDAGMRASELAGRRVGVFIAHDGWYLGAYVKRVPLDRLADQEFIVPGNAPSFLANRLSWIFDFRGPSMVFDATCSGTYVALHHACRALEIGECDYAVVAAVTLFLDPWRDQEVTATPFESAKPRMTSFAKGSSGYRTSEGCGAFLLVRQDPEVARLYSSYGTICGSGHNSGGKTASFAQPSEHQAASLFREVLQEAGLTPNQIEYVEAHGVGSQVGDAIEASALIDVFQRGEADVPCHVSTIKPNLGHSHAASGVYSLFKALLAIENGQIPPIAGLEEGLNERIPIDSRGVKFASEVVAWRKAGGAGPTTPRRVFLSSYGMSNVNAALVIQEEDAASAAPGKEENLEGSVGVTEGDASSSGVVICLSARSWAQVFGQIERLQRFLADQAGAASVDLVNLAYTLQLGREPMSHRWAAVARSLPELLEILCTALVNRRLDDDAPPGGVVGVVHDGHSAAEDRASVGDLDLMAARWVAGAPVCWEALYEHSLPRRIHAPTYPFARDRHWLPLARETSPGIDVRSTTGLLHPLLHQESSRAGEPCFVSTFSGEEFFLADHVIQGQRTLPGVAYLEMARAAVGRAIGSSAVDILPMSLENLVWARPIVVREPGQRVYLRLSAEVDGRIGFQVYTCAEEANDDGVVVHSEGTARIGATGGAPVVDLAALRAEMTGEVLDAARIYDLPPHLGLHLGPRLQGARFVHIGRDQILGRLELPDGMAHTAEQYVLHPAILDPILQLAFLGLAGRSEHRVPLTIPFSLERLDIFSGCTGSMWVWIRYASGSKREDPVARLDIDLCHDTGAICLQFSGFSFRTLVELDSFASDSSKRRVSAGFSPSLDSSFAVAAAAENRLDAAIAHLTKVVSAALGLLPEEIHASASFEGYGIDSAIVVRLTRELEVTFGTLPKTLFFEFRNIDQLARHLVDSRGEALDALIRRHAPIVRHRVAPARREPVRSSEVTLPDRLDIAVVGMNGVFPEAGSLDELWVNLCQGRDCIREVPAERWDWQAYFDEDRTRPGRHYSKWGGFIADVDKFDAFLFGIPPREAELMDPQERLFLQCAWAALEDAGYCRSSMLGSQAKGTRRIGVYAGVMYGQYQIFGAEESLRGDRIAFASTLGSIANRVSYVLDLHGPSMTIDSQCSSSLTAIHLACQDLVLGNINMGIAGGVNLSLHPGKYLELSRRQFISSKGRCESFGEGGDGYIPGEAVAVVVLKRLADAERDHDHIYGVLRASAINHGGKTNGYTVPDPSAQESVIVRAIEQARIDPCAISYVEAHGTGTKLGDPIEIEGLSRALRGPGHDDRGAQRLCWIGSIKSNIGHCESAAGVVGLMKVLLQMKHSKLVPSLHSQILNPNINFSATPFEICRELRDWQPSPCADHPRIAGVSSFGAGGSNAHVVVEEYPRGARETPQIRRGLASPVVVPLSGRDKSRLHLVAERLLAYLREESRNGDLEGDGRRRALPQLEDLAYTLQIGREALDERMAMVVGSIEELETKLSSYIAGAGDIPGCRIGMVVKRGVALRGATPADDARVVESARSEGDFSPLLERWVKGQFTEWNLLYGDETPQRISLPTYPFARERHWYKGDAPAGACTNSEQDATLGALHPILHQSSSELLEQRYRSTFTGDEPFLAGHRVNGEKVLAASVSLEMVRAAVETCGAYLREQKALVCLRDVVWSRPLVVPAGGTDVHIRLRTEDGRAKDASNTSIRFAIFGGAHKNAGDESPTAVGTVVFAPPAEAPALQLDSLRQEVTLGTLDGATLYDRLRTAGLDHGPSFRCVEEVQLGSGQALARLALPDDAREDQASHARYVLHPSLLDSALQAASCLELPPLGVADRPTSLQLPFSLDELEVYRGWTARMWAWIRYSADNGRGCEGKKIDIDLCDARGAVCVRLRGLVARTANARRSITNVVLLQPAWQPEQLNAGKGGVRPGRRWVVLCETEYAANDVSAIAGAACVAWRSNAEDPGTRFIDYALQTLDLIQRIVARSNESAAGGRSSALLQIVVPKSGEASLMAGLVGLLRCARLEHPEVIGQVILSETGEPPHILAGRIEQCAESPNDLVWCDAGQRRVLAWKELPSIQTRCPSPWEKGGVYLITGGMGGLGRIFAKEITRADEESRVVLVGRSPIGAGALSAAGLDERRIVYVSADVSRFEAVTALVQKVLAEYGALRGIIHAAGVLSDHLLLGKGAEEARRVLAPKVAGALALDEATRHLDLAFFVLFSSVASILGSVGQGDYAAGNAFLDCFATYRNHRVALGARRGRTVSISWPLWADGGMTMGEASLARIADRAGLRPMETPSGLDVFYRILESDVEHVAVFAGDASRVRSVLSGPTPLGFPDPLPPVATRAEPGALELHARDRLREHLRELLSTVLKLPAVRVHEDVSFAEYGLDSVSAVELATRLERLFGPLSKGLFLEHETISELTDFLWQAHAPKVQEHFRHSDPNGPHGPPERRSSDGEDTSSRAGEQRDDVGDENCPKGPVLAAASREALDIAIVGVSGRYPKARTLDELWTNLRDGKDCIEEIPEGRWNWRTYYRVAPAQTGAHACKWGGFIEGVDEFDASFFGMSSAEAETMDPQERLFLEHAWAAVEDAGYTREALRRGTSGESSGDIGVYVGVMYGEYQLFGERRDWGGRPGCLAGIANRVSQFLDLRGPSMTIETMCSSSLTAIHVACQELRLGNIEMGVAGGVNICIHPQKYSMLTAARLISTRPQCGSFGEGGDGYVPAEGVGVVLLKRLADAKRDGDHIHGVIRGSAINHGGRANRQRAPSPQAQRWAIERALREARITSRDISYIEAHGTGTTLGDAVEISALTAAFRKTTTDVQFCAIGSIKSNIGHCEAASGVAALTKVLLQMRHGAIAPTLHTEISNPNIDFAGSPFILSRRLETWARRVTDGAEQPRIAGISSFGAGGSNAHLIVEEYLLPTMNPVADRRAVLDRPALIPLSARTPDQLRQIAENLLHFLGAEAEIDLQDLAYTLQVGREAMAERLGLIARSPAELREKLQGFLDGRAIAHELFAGSVTDASEQYASLLDDEDVHQAVERWVAKGKLARLMQLWVLGGELDWQRLYQREKPRRISAPTYPFARERHWLDEGEGEGANVNQARRSAMLPPVREGKDEGASENQTGRSAMLPPVPELPATLGAHASSKDKVQALVITLLSNILPDGARRISRKANFASLGLESIHIVAFVASWRALLGATVPVAALYEARTPEELADYIVQHGLAPEPNLEQAGAGLTGRRMATPGPFPLSAMQRSFVVGRKLRTFGQFISSTVYVELEIRGHYTSEDLVAAWNTLQLHHDALRVVVGDDFQQTVLPAVPRYPMVVTDLSTLGTAEQQVALRARKERMAYREFDLSIWPCFEVHLSRLAAQHAVVHLSIDEVIADALSVHLLVHQLFLLSAQRDRLHDIGYTYRDYLGYLSSREAAPESRSSLEYWQRKLTPLPPAPRIARRGACSSGTAVRCLVGTLDAGLWRALKGRAEQLRCYPSTILLTVFGEVLSEATGERALRLGMTNLNRLPIHPDVMRLVGLFITSNVFVHHRVGNEAFEELVLRNQAQLEADTPHGHVSAPAILRELSRGSESDSFVELPVVFTSLVSSAFPQLPAHSGWSIRDIVTTTPNVYLDHQAFERDGVLYYHWYVPESVLESGEVQSIFAAYRAALDQQARAYARTPVRTATAAPDDSGRFPVTNQQAAYAFGRMLPSEDGGCGCALHIEMEFDDFSEGRLTRAWNDVVQHHPMLRCRVLSSGEQEILANVPEYHVEVAFRAATRDDFEAGCQRIRRQMLDHVYPLDSYPYFAVKAAVREGKKARVFVNLDLLVADARSAMLVVEHLVCRYEDPWRALPASPTSFRQHIEHRERGKARSDHAVHRTYWEDKFSRLVGGPKAISAVRAAVSERHQLFRTLRSLDRLRETAARLNVEIDSVLLAAYGEALLEWNGGVACSIVVAGWDRDPGTEEIVGDFTRLSWVSFDGTEQDRDAKILRVQAQLDMDRQHQSIDGLEILRARRGLAFPAVFTRPIPPADGRAPRSKCSQPVYVVSQTSQVVVDSIVRIVSETEFSVHWDTIATDRETEGEMFDRYCRLIEDWTGAAPTAEDGIRLPSRGVTLHALFERVSAQYGNRCAVRFADTSISYGELEERSRRCAGQLLARGVKPDDVVGVLMDRSIEMVVGILGALRAGAAYLPLDVSSPAGRVQQILETARPKCVLTHGQQTDRCRLLGIPEPLCVEDGGAQTSDERLPDAAFEVPTERNLAYVIYTSGSTGRPKGCMIEHRSIVNRLSWMQAQYPLEVGDAVLHKTPYTFDVSVWEIFWPLIVGGTLVIAKPGGHLDAGYILDLIQSEQIRVCHFVPSMLRMMLSEPDLARMSALRRVVVSGEALDYDLLELFMNRLAMPLENLYGPTEAAVDVTFWTCERNPEKQVPIGRPIARVQIYILNDAMDPVAPGEVGELYIGGVAVGRGYLGDREMTAKSFVAAPFGRRSTLYRTGDLAAYAEDGNILFFGRRDGQVKLNGLRIELGEIEHHIRCHPAVEDANVSVEQALGQESLVAYIVLRDRSQKLSGRVLRAFLLERLPSYMVPHAWVRVGAIPLTAHGKRKHGAERGIAKDGRGDDQVQRERWVMDRLRGVP